MMASHSAPANAGASSRKELLFERVSRVFRLARFASDPGLLCMGCLGQFSGTSIQSSALTCGVYDSMLYLTAFADVSRQLYTLLVNEAVLDAVLLLRTLVQSLLQKDSTISLPLCLKHYDSKQDEEAILGLLVLLHEEDHQPDNMHQVLMAGANTPVPNKKAAGGAYAVHPVPSSCFSRASS